MIDGMRSQLADLQDEVRAYDDLRAGRIHGRVLSYIGDLANVLIEGRIFRDGEFHIGVGRRDAGLNQVPRRPATDRQAVGVHLRGHQELERDGRKTLTR
jgi:hypothetical protein